MLSSTSRPNFLLLSFELLLQDLNIDDGGDKVSTAKDTAVADVEEDNGAEAHHAESETASPLQSPVLSLKNTSP